MDSGYVAQFKTKENNFYQFFDLKNQPMILQIYSKGKNYKFSVTNEYAVPASKVGFGNSNIFLYDIDKDGEDEIIIKFINTLDGYLYCQVYKIVLPK